MNHIIYIEFTHTDDTTKIMKADEFTGITLSGITEKHSSSFKTINPKLPPHHNPKIVSVSYSAKTLDMSMPYTVDMFLYFTKSKPINKITIAYSGGSEKTYSLSVPNLQLDNNFSPFQTLFVYDTPEKLEDHFLTLTIHPFDEKEIEQFPVRHITSYVQRFPGDNRSDDGMPLELFDYDDYDDYDEWDDWDDDAPSGWNDINWNL